MRLIGIQALLPLLQVREAATAQASGLGGGSLVSNAGVRAVAAGAGSAHASGLGVTGLGQANAHGNGFAIGVGQQTGVYIGAAQAQGIGSSSIVGIIITAGVGSAAGIGAGSAIGAAVGTTNATASASGVGSASGIVGTEATAFLNRTSGLDSAHRAAYSTLINGLVADGVWSKLDVLYIFATQNTTTALLNLISSSFSGIVHGSPTFTTDRGYTGVDGSTTVYIDSGFNPSIAGGQFATNSCHASAWCDTSVTAGSSGGGFLGNNAITFQNQTSVFGRYSDGKAYFRINDFGASGGFTSTSSVGHWIASRTGSNTSTGFKNGSSFATPNVVSGTLANNNISILAINNNGTIGSGTGGQLTMASLGGGLTATDATNFYNRLRTYMTSVGVP